MSIPLTLRSATPHDGELLFDLIKALANYEKLSHQVSGSVEALAQDLAGDPPKIEALLADWEGQTVGFALFFANYSTFLTRPGLYLEDLFVLPSHRRLGIGKALLTELATRAAQRGAGRLEWSVLDWNQSAIAFYESFGATVLPDWRICRVTQDKLRAIAYSPEQPPE